MLALQLSLTASLPHMSGSCWVLTGQAPLSGGAFGTMTLLTHPRPTPNQWYCFVLRSLFPEVFPALLPGDTSVNPKGQRREPGSPPPLPLFSPGGTLASSAFQTMVPRGLLAFALALTRCPHKDSCSPHTGLEANPK